MGGCISSQTVPIDSDYNLEKALDQVAFEEKNLAHLKKISHFDIDLLRKLHKMFLHISSSLEDDGLIDCCEFAKSLGLRPKSLLVRRLFHEFNVTKTERMNFREFVMALSLLSDLASREKKIQFSFALYDLNRDGCIDSSELRSLVVAALEESDVRLSEETITLICNNTLQITDENCNGVIDYFEYQNLVENNPRLLIPFTINVQELVDSSHFHAGFENTRDVSSRTLHHGPLQSRRSKNKSRLFSSTFNFSRTKEVKSITNVNQL